MSAVALDGLPTVNRPCPPWCELPTGHGWNDHGINVVGDDGRGHGYTLGTIEGCDLSVGLSTFESSLRGGPSTFSPVVIEIDGRVGEEVTAKQARDLAAALMEAARIIEAATV